MHKSRAVVSSATTRVKTKKLVTWSIPTRAVVSTPVSKPSKSHSTTIAWLYQRITPKRRMIWTLLVTAWTREKSNKSKNKPTNPSWFRLARNAFITKFNRLATLLKIKTMKCILQNWMVHKASIVKGLWPQTARGSTTARPSTSSPANCCWDLLPPTQTMRLRVQNCRKTSIFLFLIITMLGSTNC